MTGHFTKKLVCDFPRNFPDSTDSFFMGNIVIVDQDVLAIRQHSPVVWRTDRVRYSNGVHFRQLVLEAAKFFQSLQSGNGIVQCILCFRDGIWSCPDPVQSFFGQFGKLVCHWLQFWYNNRKQVWRHDGRCSEGCLVGAIGAIGEGKDLENQ